MALQSSLIQAGRVTSFRSRSRFSRFSSTSAPSSSSPSRPLKLAIIGSGPSGFYAASRILHLIPISSGLDIQVHMYERLPTPYGLARYGVAPDHPEVKNCQHKFDELVSDPRFRFFGNVSIGTQSSALSSPSPTTSRLCSSPYTYPHALHLPLSSLAPYYSSILFTYGASLSIPLSSVPGSSSSADPLSGVIPALAFVSWYNGHPAFTHLNPDLSSIQNVDIIGQGNVALDVARILLSQPSTLEETDIPDPVLDVLKASNVRKVRVIGRRGPAQVAFTTKEFREMINLSTVSYPGINPEWMKLAKEMVGNERVRKRLLTLMDKPAFKEDGRQTFELDFFKSPKALIGDDKGNVKQVEWEINELVPPIESGVDPTRVKVRSTGEKCTSEADWVVESVGYRSEPLGVGQGDWCIPFDSEKGRVKNLNGRVVGESDQIIPGLYVAGWAARGPVGVIASTMNDAYTVASTIIQDHQAQVSSSATNPTQIMSLSANPASGIPEKIETGLREKKVVDFQSWEKIDYAEKKRAKDMGKNKEREKFRTVEEMLAVL